MMDFPASPTEGQVFSPAGAPSYQYVGGVWVPTIAGGGGGSGGAAVYVEDAPPADAEANSLWWESDTGNLYLLYDDGDGEQWVQVAPGDGGSGAYLPLTGGTLDGGATGTTLTVGVSSPSMLNVVSAGAPADLNVMSNTAPASLTVGNGVGPAASLRLDGGFSSTLTMAAGGGNAVVNVTGSYDTSFNFDNVSKTAKVLFSSKRDNKKRWDMAIGDGAFEDGTGSGNNFTLTRFNDAGTIIDVPFSVNRKSGYTKINGLYDEATAKSLSAGDMIKGAGRAWALINGSAAPASISVAFNVTSVTDGGVGIYTYNLTSIVTAPVTTISTTNGAAILGSSTGAYQLAYSQNFASAPIDTFQAMHIFGHSV